MANEEALREIIRTLKSLGVDKETALTVCLRVRRPEHEAKMLQWLRTNPDADPMEAIRASREIAEQYAKNS